MRIFIAAAGVALLAGCGSQPAPKDDSVKLFMKDEVQPKAEVFWNSAGYVVDAEGEHDLTPTTDEGWRATQDAATAIVESGKLLMTPQYAEGRGDDWMQFSQSMVEIGQKAEKAAADRDSDAVFEVGGTMYNVCSACHQVYLLAEPPPTEEPPAEDGATTE